MVISTGNSTRKINGTSATAAVVPPRPVPVCSLSLPCITVTSFCL